MKIKATRCHQIKTKLGNTPLGATMGKFGVPSHPILNLNRVDFIPQFANEKHI